MGSTRVRFHSVPSELAYKHNRKKGCRKKMKKRRKYTKRHKSKKSKKKGDKHFFIKMTYWLQCRIERPSVITGGLKSSSKPKRGG